MKLVYRLLAATTLFYSLQKMTFAKVAYLSIICFRT